MTSLMTSRIASLMAPVIRYDIASDAALGMYVRNLASPTVTSAAMTRSLIKQGNTNRAVGVTNLNEQSSRSHMLVTLVVLTTNKRTGASQHSAEHSHSPEHSHSAEHSPTKPQMAPLMAANGLTDGSTDGPTDGSADGSRRRGSARGQAQPRRPRGF